jgi:predicted esterase
MSKARAITYHDTPDPGTTQTEPYSNPATYRSPGVTYSNGQVLYRYSDYASWATAPDLVTIWVQGLGFASPVLPATVIGHFAKFGGDSTEGNGLILGIDYRGGAWPRQLEDVIAAGDWVTSNYAGIPFIYAGHSAGAHLAAHAAHHHDVPWLGANGFYRWQDLNDTGSWATPAADARSEVGFTAGQEPREADVPFSTNSPPCYLIYSDADDVVHPDGTENVIPILKNFGVDLWIDDITTGTAGERDHYPWSQMNMDGCSDWFNRWRT